MSIGAAYFFVDTILHGITKRRADLCGIGCAMKIPPDMLNFLPDKAPFWLFFCLGINVLGLFVPSLSPIVHCLTAGLLVVGRLNNKPVSNRRENEGNIAGFLEESTPTESRNGFQLTQMELNDYKLRLEQYLNDEQPYLNPGLRIQDVAESLGIPRHHLSIVINQQYSINFNQLINGYRIGYIKTRLKDPEWANFTWEGIAMESGFGSRATFLRVFKKETGMLPTVYAEQVAQ